MNVKIYVFVSPEVAVKRAAMRCLGETVVCQKLRTEDGFPGQVGLPY